MILSLPLRTVSGLNVREHWRTRARRVKLERQAVVFAWTFKERRWVAGNGPPYRVRLTRLGPRRLDSDNVQGALKAVRDQVAALLGIDDGSPLVTWEYAQEVGPYGVRIEVTCA